MGYCCYYIRCTLGVAAFLSEELDTHHCYYRTAGGRSIQILVKVVILQCKSTSKNPVQQKYRSINHKMYLCKYSITRYNMVYKWIMSDNIIKRSCNCVKYVLIWDVIIVERHCTVIKYVLISAYYIIVSIKKNLLNVYILLINAMQWT